MARALTIEEEKKLKRLDKRIQKAFKEIKEMNLQGYLSSQNLQLYDEKVNPVDLNHNDILYEIHNVTCDSGDW